MAESQRCRPVGAPAKAYAASIAIAAILHALVVTYLVMQTGAFDSVRLAFLASNLAPPLMAGVLAWWTVKRFQGAQIVVGDRPTRTGQSARVALFVVAMACVIIETLWGAGGAAEYLVWDFGWNRAFSFDPRSVAVVVGPCLIVLAVAGWLLDVAIG